MVPSSDLFSFSPVKWSNIIMNEGNENLDGDGKEWYKILDEMMKMLRGGIPNSLSWIFIITMILKDVLFIA